MSTKIYNGHKIYVETLEELHDFNSRMRRRLKEKAEKRTAQKESEWLALYHDHYQVTGLFHDLTTGKNEYSLNNILSLVRSNLADITRKQNTFEWCIFPSVFATRLLAMVFCNHFTLREGDFKDSQVKYYGYWDNTNRPKGLSKKEWEIRESDWNYALGKLSIPCEAGMTVSLAADWNIPMRFDKPKARLPSRDKRIQNLTNYFVNQVAQYRLFERKIDARGPVFSAFIEEKEKLSSVKDEFASIIAEKISEKIDNNLLTEKLPIATLEEVKNRTMKIFK